ATFTTANVSSGTKLIAAAAVSDQSGLGSTTSSVKDAALNSMTLIGRKSAGSPTAVDVSLWAMDTPAGDVGTKPTLTATATNNSQISILIQEVSGLLAGNTTAMADGTLGSNTGTGGASTGSPTYSSTALNEYLVSVYGDDGGPETWTKPAGTTSDPNSVNSNAHADCAIAYTNSTNGAEAGSWALTGTSAQWCTLLVAFKISGGGGGGATPGPATRAAPGKTWRRYFQGNRDQQPSTGNQTGSSPTSGQDITGTGALTSAGSKGGSGASAISGTGTAAPGGFAFSVNPGN